MNNETTEDEIQTVGNYRLTKTLGKGTFGKVKKAEHITTGEIVAVKVLQKQLICEQADVERISREIKILKLIQHEYLIQLYEIIEQTQQLYLIMEFASGGDLFQEIVNRQRIPEADSATYFYEILQGVKQLHSLGITHRDLKPENILLDGNKIKIADFGLGNFFKEGELLKTACGSPCYAAPEMVSKLKYNPIKIDIWSSGIILYAMNCGFLPFEDKNVNTLYSKIKKGEFRMPNHLSEPLKDLLKSILNINSEERFTIQQILAHPWMNNAKRYQPAPYKSLCSNEGLLENVSSIYGYDKEKLKRSLNTNKHNAMTTTFYLYVKKEQIRPSTRQASALKDNVNQQVTEQSSINEKQPSKTDEQQITDTNKTNKQQQEQQPKADFVQPIYVSDSLKQSENKTFVTENVSLKESLVINAQNIPESYPRHHQVEIPMFQQLQVQNRHIDDLAQANSAENQQHQILIKEENVDKPLGSIRNIPTLTFPKSAQESQKTEPRQMPKAGRYPLTIAHKKKAVQPQIIPKQIPKQINKQKSNKKIDISFRQSPQIQSPPQPRLPVQQPSSINSSIATEAQEKLKKNPRMKIENMKKTATKLYERSASRSTESIRLIQKKPQRRFNWKRIEKKPRLINTSLIFVGRVETLKKYLLDQEDQRQDISVEFYELRQNVLYILRSNIESERMTKHLKALMDIY